MPNSRAAGVGPSPVRSARKSTAGSTTAGSKRCGHLVSYSGAIRPVKEFSGTGPSCQESAGASRGTGGVSPYAACDWVIQVWYISA